jgi:hypothetical protein
MTHKEQGATESVDGWWRVEWDNRHNSYLTFTVIDNDDGQRYRARYDDGWRVAPEATPQVDHEQLIGNEVQAYSPELEGLVQTLNLVSGRSL